MQMAKTLGFEIQHAPGNGFYGGFLNRMDVMGDTPCFRPSVVEDMLKKSDDIKFIYLEKDDGQAWVESMVKVGLHRNYNNMYGQRESDPSSLNVHNKIDLESLEEVLGGPFNEETAQDAYAQHRNKIIEMVPADRLLIYSFDQGWGPLCEFMGKDVPETDVPHLNKDTMFDNITG